MAGKTDGYSPTTTANGAHKRSITAKQNFYFKWLFHITNIGLIIHHRDLDEIGWVITTFWTGGLLTVFKDTLHCRSLPTGVYNSFKVQLFELVSINPIVIALIYWPPQQNNSFLSEIAELLGDLASRYGKILLLGDFNIHLCCPSKPYAAEFLTLFESLEFTQWVSGSKHNFGHNIVLVLTHGLSITSINLSTAVFLITSP